MKVIYNQKNKNDIDNLIEEKINELHELKNKKYFIYNIISNIVKVVLWVGFILICIQMFINPSTNFLWKTIKGYVRNYFSSDSIFIVSNITFITFCISLCIINGLFITFKFILSTIDKFVSKLTHHQDRLEKIYKICKQIDDLKNIHYYVEFSDMLKEQDQNYLVGADFYKFDNGFAVYVKENGFKVKKTLKINEDNVKSMIKDNCIDFSYIDNIIEEYSYSLSC